MSEQAYIRTIAKLNELTQSGALRWNRIDRPAQLDLGRDKTVSLIYEAEYRGRRVRLYEEEFKHWIDEDLYGWTSKAVLAIVDANGQNEWEFPRLAITWDLLESVRFQSAGVSKFVNDVLSNE